MKKHGFKGAQREALKALKEGRIQHEPRSTLSEKNLLSTGDVDVDFVTHLIQSTASRDAGNNPHHFLDVEVWVFKPMVAGVRWYTKFYLINDLWFISVHRSEAEGFL